MQNKKHRFSICIPTWEQNGVGAQYLRELLVSIKNQSFQDYEVVVSDHSKNDDIFNLWYSWGGQFEKFVYVRNEDDYGNGPANTNNAIKNANGEIIKIMFQDDLMCSPECLELIDKTFSEDTTWLVNGYNHTTDGKNFFRADIPCWNENIIRGVNTIGSPSVLSFRREVKNLFDKNLVMLMDVEFYYGMFLKYGLPTLMPRILVANRQHDEQISSKYSGNIDEEIQYVIHKYNL